MHRSKTIILFFLSLFIGLAIAESLLRLFFGIEPGRHNYDRSFTKVDSLFILKGFYADSEGIFRVDPATIKDINGRLAAPNIPRYDHLFDPHTEVDEIYTVADEMRDVMLNKETNSFQSVYRSILSKKEGQTDLDSALIYFVHHPINNDGFCGIPIKPYRSGKKKILLLGDSFTWGRTVKNITSAFANELLAKGYTVYNTGVSGADPPQYLALAKKFIPVLKPDIVIVNFAMGSDIMNSPRPLVPFQPIFYRTNAGYLFSSPQGVYLNGPKETYLFIKDEATIPSTSCFNKLCKLSAVGTAIWKFLFSIGLVGNQHPEHDEYWQKVKDSFSEIPYSNADLAYIQKVSTDYGAKCIIVAIPDLRPGGACDPKKIPHLFENIPYVYSPVKKNGYSLSDGHFNTLGHKEYAKFLDSLIQNTETK